MQLDAIIVLENGRGDDTTRMLARVGLPTVFVDDLHRALNRIDHDHFRAAVITETAEVDALEFTLGARDRQENLPIVVVASRRSEPVRKALKRLDAVYIVDDQGGDLVTTLKAILNSEDQR